MRSSFIPLFLFALICAGCGSGSDALQPPASPPPPSADAAPAPVETERAVQTADTVEPVPVAQPVHASAPRTLQQRINDVNAEARVIQTLVRQDELRVFDFDATVKSGALTLSGDVNTIQQRRLINRVVRRIQGVSSVSNTVTVAGQTLEMAIAEAKQEGSKAAEEDDRNVYYTVRSGDTLWNIARQHSASIQQIKTMNRINGSSLQPGQRIRVR